MSERVHSLPEIIHITEPGNRRWTTEERHSNTELPCTACEIISLRLSVKRFQDLADNAERGGRILQEWYEQCQQRLQRAKAVVEAAGAWHEVTLTKLMHGRANQAEIALEKALAAWDAGKETR